MSYPGVILQLIKIYRGSTHPQMTFACTYGGVATDLTGYTVKSEMRDATTNTLILDLGATVPTPANGTIILPALTDEATEALTAGRAVADLFIETAGGVREVICSWKVKIVDTVTER